MGVAYSPQMTESSVLQEVVACVRRIPLLTNLVWPLPDWVLSEENVFTVHSENILCEQCLYTLEYPFISPDT